MKIIRKNTFETNSSSTHALVIPKQVKDEEYTLYDSLDHDYYFGRGESRLVESWDEKFAYAYMILKTTMEWTESNNSWKPKHQIHKEDLNQFVYNVQVAYYQVMDDLNKNEPSFTLEDLIKYLDSDREDGDITGDDSFHILMERNGKYVDHANGLDNTDFIDRLLNDIEFVKRFIFNKDSYITIGGDEYRGYNIKTIGFEYDYESEFYNFGTEEEPDYQDVGEFWDKLEKYKEKNDVYLKGE